ncbi:MAG: ABC transporter substrate-binding protein [SAR324 cluster bacterium]|nr:ABC transporter substrate-binding protein [SAR324 cluster bacterium]
MILRTFFAAVAVFFLAIGLVLMPLADAQAAKRGGKLIYMIPSKGAKSLDGHKETSFATVHPTAPFYSLLIQVDPLVPGAKKLKGEIAKSWKISADNLTYTFKIRRGVKFHNGTPMTSRDVLATWNKLVFPPKGVLSARKQMFSMVKSISAPDDYTIVFKLKFASPALIWAMAMPFNYIYSADILEKDMHYYEKNIMGTGPFKFVEYVPRVRIKGERFKDYFVAGRPYLDAIEGIFASKQSVYVAALESGRIHSMFRGLPPAAVEDLLRIKGSALTVQRSVWNCALNVTPNSYKKPFDDVRVRRALSLALDRWGGSGYLSKRAIVKTVGGAVFPGHPLAPSRAQLESLEGYSRDIKASRAKARRLLKEAGIPKGFKFTFRNRTTDQPYKVVGIWLLDQWRQIGLNVKQEVLPTSKFWDSLRRPKNRMTDASAYVVSMDFNCQAVVNPTLDVSKYVSYSGSNYTKIEDTVIDDLFDRQLREPDFDKQKALLWKFQQRLTSQARTFSTLWWQRAVVHSSKMKNWNITPSHYLNMGLVDVWLDQ